MNIAVDPSSFPLQRSLTWQQISSHAVLWIPSVDEYMRIKHVTAVSRCALREKVLVDTATFGGSPSNAPPGSKH